MDKSTCQTYNLKEGIFGYNGVPTARTVALLDEISENYGVFLMAIAQPTHCYDFNGCDALLHSTQKRKLRSFPAPLCTQHIVRDWTLACEQSCHARLIQKSFVRALRRDENGDLDVSLIPRPILKWYEKREQSESDDEDASDDVEWE